MGLYTNWAAAIVDHNQAPYSGFSIEYPPVIPPFVAIPEIRRATTSPYYERFVKLMLLVDILCFACVLLLARKWGSLLGPVMWIFGSLLLGPISYVRLDLLPALLTLLAVLCMAYGCVARRGRLARVRPLAKVYPMFLFPVALAYSTRRKQMLIGGAIVSALVLLPYIGSLDDMWRSVVTYHTDRGLETGKHMGESDLRPWEVGIRVLERLALRHNPTSPHPSRMGSRRFRWCCRLAFLIGGR